MKKNGFLRLLCVAIALILAVTPASLHININTVRAEGVIKSFLEGDEAYLTSFTVKSIADGSGDWDADDERGHDKNATNRRVRSNDSVKYTLSYTAASYNTNVGYHTAYMFYEVELPLTKEQAYFDIDSMSWIVKNDPNPKYNYIYTVDKATGHQKLKFAMRLEPKGDNKSTIPGSGDTDFVIAVKNMYEGEKIQPIFHAYLDGNDVSGNTCPPGKHVEEYKTFIPEEVTVTSRPGYNVEILKSWEDAIYATGTWDFDSGVEGKALNKGKGMVPGRLVGFGLAVQMYNPDTNKTLKGIEPLDTSKPITFDIDMSSKFMQGTTTLKDLNLDPKYTPLVWYAGPNDETGENPAGRDLSAVASFAHLSAPFNKNRYNYTLDANGALSNPDNTVDCWNGGNWKITQEGRTLHVEITDYEINPNWFPTARSGEDTSSGGGYYKDKKHLGCISGGELFIVVPYSDLQEINASGDIDLQLVVKNFKATSKSAAANALENDVTEVAVDPDDNHASHLVHFSRSGTWVNKVHYAYYQNKGWIGWAEDCTGDGGADNYRHGGDALAVGGNVAAVWGVSARAMINILWRQASFCLSLIQMLWNLMTSITIRTKKKHLSRI